MMTDHDSHPDGALTNIVTGQIAHPDGNADDAVSLGQRAMSNFLAGWPRSFYYPLGKLVVTVDVMKKHMSVGKKRVYDQELIDARLLANSREINTDNFDVLAYELPAYPPSMFNPGSEMKITKSKSTLKLQVVISERNCPIPETFIYDVSALLWVLTWPSDKLHVYMDAFLLFVHQALQKSNVTLVFDRYFPNSTKNFTRMQRARLNRVYRLTPEMPAPAKPVILTNTKNKIQPNAMLVEGPLNSDYYTHATQKHTPTTAVVVVSDVPMEIVDSVRIDRQDHTRRLISS